MSHDLAGPGKRGESGFTLVELLVSLVIFALISIAGAQLVETMIGVQDRTKARGDQLGALQRGFYLFSSDLEHLVDGPRLDNGVLTFARASAGNDYVVSYRFVDDGLYRAVDGNEQVVLTGVESHGMRFLKGNTWQPVPASEQDPSRPRAVEISVVIATRPGVTGGPVRRVVELPEEQP